MPGQQQTEAARARAEARFKLQEQRVIDANKVMEEINAAGAAERAKTARLRALRLAREEADRAAAAAAAALPKVKKARAPAKSRNLGQ